MNKGMETAKWKWLLCFIIVSILIWFILKYLIVLFLPLVVAFILTRLVYPAALHLRRFCRKMHIPISSRICRISVFFCYIAALGGFLLWVGIQLFWQIRKFLENIGAYKLWLESMIYQCCCQCDGILGFSNGETFEKLQLVFTEGNGSFWQEKLSYIPLSAVSIFGIMGKIGLILLFSVFLTIMALLNLERWYLQYRHCGFYRECHEILRELTGAGFAFVRTEIIIIFCISLVCVIGLFFMGNSYALLAGIGIAIVDALPVLGSGTVFFPWIVVAAISGRWGEVGTLVLLYALCQMIRQTLEPKLMGKRLEVEPAVMLVSIFAGLKLFSIAGVLLGPVGFLLIRAVMKLVVAEFPSLRWRRA